MSMRLKYEPASGPLHMLSGEGGVEFESVQPPTRAPFISFRVVMELARGSPGIRPHVE